MTGQYIKHVVFLGIYDDTVILLTPGIALEFINRKNLRQLGQLEGDAFEITHGGCTRNVKLRADL